MVWETHLFIVDQLNQQLTEKTQPYENPYTEVKTYLTKDQW